MESQQAPDNSRFEVEDSCAHGRYLVLKVKYESCEKCAFEGSKILVYRDCSLQQAIRWKVIDPHFRPDPRSEKQRDPRQAPSPIARFPADQWEHAYACICWLDTSSES
jgi:hypothetical protein